MVVRAVLDQGEKKDFKRVVWGFGEQKVVKTSALGSVFPQELFFPPKFVTLLRRNGAFLAAAQPRDAAKAKTRVK